MKHFILLCIAVSFSIGAFAQKVKEADVPQVVKDAFSKMYPNATVEKWEKENGNYEAEFDLNKVDNSAVFTPEGSLVMTEIEITTGELPQGARDYVKNNLGNKKITEASKITSASGEVTFEAEVGGKDYIFDANGTYLRTEAEDND